MNDSELNALIAEKVMGCSIQWVNDIPFRSYPMGTAPGSPYTLSAEKIELHPVPNYCNDIASAWQIALKVAAIPGYIVTIHVGDEVWIEKITETDNGGDHAVSWQAVAKVGVSEGDARAICLAALEAMG